MATAYVVDASVVIKYFLTETYTPEVRVLVAGMSGDNRLYIPEFCPIECVNVLWSNVRFRGLIQTDAEQFVIDLLDLPFQIVPVKNLLPRALQIGLTHQLAVYDSLYIALALDMGFPLITVDDKQLNAATACGVVIKPITDFWPL
ncbi:type II toxin-antitoxin system VapC family toxin [Argonema antarcticum]|uniref:type II toxin-antitoxin system VapC family toxin n=1 Tax=Argonema antarcticum TaxID=2942763 RepID=UPI0020128046|nr:type II toxin-antitoxin system VapC family toxin [Argonema antarcticum]MCL1469263.1 type II toxin-antitoxin system VapC family toxin [Argonema antarcticum A004/B2]